MPPIYLREDLGTDRYREELRLVTGRVQRTLARFNNQRTIPVVG